MSSDTEQNTYTFKFSGHESFPCKTLWLKKEYDFVKKDLDFNDPEDVINLYSIKNDCIYSK
ncbi:MAG: DUF4007 family protein [Bacteroidales bacterium]|nr:DUF4007 family protein [Bacteroidales bacterium]